MTAATCEVWVDGVRASQTPAGIRSGEPTLLDGLSLTWGRARTLEQPDASTVTMSIRDQNLTDERTILDVIHVGSKIAVWSEGIIPNVGNTGNEVVTDGSFTAASLGVLPTSRYDLASGADTPALTVVSGSAGRAVRVQRDALSLRTIVPIFPPQPFEADGLNPNAWDDVSKLMPGKTWKFSVRVRMIPTNRATVALRAYSAPWKSAGAGLGSAYTVRQSAVSSSNGYVKISGTVTMEADGPPAGVWLGIGISASLPAPTRWRDMSGTWRQQTVTWNEYNTFYVDDVSFVAPEESLRRVLVVSGEVTDVSGAASGDHAVEIATTSGDITVQLANDTIGDNPWPKETLAARVARIMVRARTQIPITIDPTLRTTLVAARDIDSQPVLGLLQDLAQTVGGILWSATHSVTGPYLWMEDPGNRAAVRAFQMVDGEVRIVRTGRDVALISAKDILRDPVSWKQSVSDVITAVDVSWVQTGPNDSDGKPTTVDRVWRTVDDTAKAKYGLRLLQLSTELTTEADAASIAERMLTNARRVEWHVEGYTLDTRALTRSIDTLPDRERVQTSMDLLDGTARIGMALELVDLPTYTPAGALGSGYLEGGTYTYADGFWVFDLRISPAGAQGYSARWKDLPTAWSWNDLDPTITWADAYGTAANA